MILANYPRSLEIIPNKILCRYVFSYVELLLCGRILCK